ncbi:MAG TPA: hypothetical protein VLC92_07995 [Rhodocyclaceae bacterium]|nr:hypothetical protein [Rhodocyclaceae bacterium]
MSALPALTQLTRSEAVRDLCKTIVIPAKAGIQLARPVLDSGFRRDDELTFGVSRKFQPYFHELRKIVNRFSVTARLVHRRCCTAQCIQADQSSSGGSLLASANDLSATRWHE